MLFSPRFREPIASGAVTVTFRRWKRTQAIAGHRYRTGAGIIEVDAVDIIGEGDITDGDARASGYPDRAALLADLRGEPGTPVHRVRFHAVHEPDPRSVLAETDDLTTDDVAAIDARLDRLDNASGHGPWTRQTLELIARRPEVRAGDLADEVGRERLAFKVDVRKLKGLGLTISLERGYRLSPRGQAYLRRTAR